MRTRHPSDGPLVRVGVYPVAIPRVDRRNSVRAGESDSSARPGASTLQPVVHAVDFVTLERDPVASGVVELRIRIGAQHDRVAVENEVLGKDKRSTVAHDRDTTERVPREKCGALLTAVACTGLRRRAHHGDSRDALGAAVPAIGPTVSRGFRQAVRRARREPGGRSRCLRVPRARRSIRRRRSRRSHPRRRAIRFA